jgi:hypothetical protein
VKRVLARSCVCSGSRGQAAHRRARDRLGRVVEHDALDRVADILAPLLNAVIFNADAVRANLSPLPTWSRRPLAIP